MNEHKNKINTYLDGISKREEVNPFLTKENIPDLRPTKEEITEVVKEELPAIVQPLIPELIPEPIPGPPGEPGKPGKPGKDYILTEQDKKEIAQKIEVPTKKTEVIIREQPIITNNITEITKEVAVADDAEAIRDKLGGLIGDDRLDKSAIRGIEELEKKVENSQSRGVKASGGQVGLHTYVNEDKKGVLKSLNFKNGTNTTVVHSKINGLDTITINADSVGESVDLTSEVTGVLPIANGGTNNSSAYTAGSVIFSDGTKLTQDNSNLFWDDTNNRLGIGTAAPSHKLDVSGSVRSGGYILDGGTAFGAPDPIVYNSAVASPTTNFAFTQNSSGNTVFNGTVVDFRVGNGQVMRVDSTGKVGIGTAAPDYKLEVNGGVKGGGFILDGGASFGAPDPIIYNSAVASPSTNFAFNQNSSGTTVFNGVTVDFRSGNSQVMRIDTTGNVGIGVTDPAAKLEVTGNFAFTEGAARDIYFPTDNASNALRFFTSTAANFDAGTPNGAGIQFFNSSHANFPGQLYLDSGVNATAALIFRTASSGSITERMRITAAGNVGIGTTPNANAILDVASTTKAFMPPRMTTTQRDNIASPTAGMVVYNTSTGKLNLYTTAWEAITSA